MSPAAANEPASEARAWRPGPDDLALAECTVHVWRVELDRVDPTLAELLAPGERERSARILDARRRELWRRSRGVLRTLLAGYLHDDPRALSLVEGPHGKPELAGGALRFNLSHSHGLALYAFAREHDVGVDLELAPPNGARRDRDRVALARRALGEDAALALQRLEPRSREAEFLRLWTRHEAVLKWRGSGFAGALSGAASAAAAGALAGEPWLVELDVGSRGAGALACSTAPRELRCFELRSAR